MEFCRILEFVGAQPLYCYLNGIQSVRSNRGSLFLRHRKTNGRGSIGLSIKSHWLFRGIIAHYEPIPNKEPYRDPSVVGCPALRVSQARLDSKDARGRWHRVGLDLFWGTLCICIGPGFRFACVDSSNGIAFSNGRRGVDSLLVSKMGRSCSLRGIGSQAIGKTHASRWRRIIRRHRALTQRLGTVEVSGTLQSGFSPSRRGFRKKEFPGSHPFVASSGMGKIGRAHV